MNGRFLVNRRDAKVMGVAAGLADYTGVDPLVDPPRLCRRDPDHRPGHDPALPADRLARARPLRIRRTLARAARRCDRSCAAKEIRRCASF